MIAITALIVILSIIALIVILLHFSAALYVKLDENGVSYEVKYFGFTIMSNRGKPKKAAKARSKSSEDTKAEEKPDITEDIDDDINEFDDDILSDISDYELMHGVSDPNKKTVAEAEKKDEKTEDSEEKDTSEESSEKNKSEKKRKDKKEKKSKDEIEKKDEEKSEGKLASLKSKYMKIKPYIPMTWKYFKKLLKTIRISIDRVDIAIGREDAHEAAIYYGALQGIIANLLSLFSEMFTVRVKHCDVECIFIRNDIDARAELSVRIRPSTVIAIVVCFAVNFLTIWLKSKKSDKKGAQIAKAA